MNSDLSIAMCVTGWHYPDHFYAQLSTLSGVEIFVISHRPPEDVPTSIYRHLDPSHFFFEPNLGYDWGCFQQFLQKGQWTQFDYIFFIHDDVLIKDLGFVNRSIELLNAGYRVIGNGRPGPPKEWPKLTTHVYAYASFKPPRDFKHDVVRGSFVATTRQALEELAAFEVFWDPLHLTSAFGNWSLIATCAKWQYRCGEKCFFFLSEEYCVSEYLHELVRGSSDTESTQMGNPLKKVATRLIERISVTYMNIYWHKNPHSWQIVALWLLTPLIRLASGQPLRLAAGWQLERP